MPQLALAVAVAMLKRALALQFIRDRDTQRPVPPLSPQCISEITPPPKRTRLDAVLSDSTAGVGKRLRVGCVVCLLTPCPREAPPPIQNQTLARNLTVIASQRQLHPTRRLLDKISKGRTSAVEAQRFADDIHKAYDSGNHIIDGLASLGAHGCQPQNCH